MIKAWANVIRTQYLIPLHYDKIYVSSVCFGAIVNLIINIILIPKFAAVGAVIGTICAELVVMLYQTCFTVHKLPIGQYVRQGIYYLLAGSIMFVSLRCFASHVSNSLSHLIFEVLLGIIVYVAVCFPYINVRYKILKRRRYS